MTSPSLRLGALAMIEAENPHAAFTLPRAYAENTAAILYVKDHPNRVDHPSGSILGMSVESRA